MTSHNPLLQKSSVKNFAPAFDQIEIDHFLPAFKDAIEIGRKNIQSIKDNKNAPDFDNTITALEAATTQLSDVSSVFYNQLSAVGGDDLHALTKDISPLTSSFYSDINLDADLFARVKQVHDQKDTLTLTAEQQTLLDDTYKGFVLSGALLNDTDKARLREISQELAPLSPAFMQNVSKSAEKFELHITQESDLSGLPDAAKETAAATAKEKGKDGWVFTLDYPSYIPFMKFADNRELRETMWRGFSNRAFQDEYDNCDNILKIVRLKHERAQLLGFKNHADYVLQERMAGSPQAVWNFLEELKNAYKPVAEKELAELKAFAKETDGITDLKPWDSGYYTEKLGQKLFEVSSEDFRPYLELNSTLKGCFQHFEKLFDIRFEPSSDYPTWHEDVKTFDVYNNSDNSFVGTLYGDFHPRPGKKPGAWKTNYRGQGLYHGTVERPVIAIVCNFTKPTKTRPALLSHDEVTTLFHEMGHAVHGLLSDVTHPSLSGTSVKWDFVELPSQLQENWCFEQETLDLFAKHYETGEKIPTELIEKLNKAKNFMGGMFGLRQISLGTLDMAWHTSDPADITDPASFEDQALEGLLLFPRLGGITSSSFNHIFAGGYSAGYYSYKWAEVLDADAFEAFKETSLYDPATAAAYKDNILTKGGSENPSILYKRFRGRDADPKALLRREGLAA